MPNRPRQHGFTIIELIVTMAILGLLLFLVNQLFQQTSRAVTTSVQASKTIAQSRSVNEQLSNDEDAMLGPGVSEDGGFIVIVQHQLNDVAMLDPQTLNEVTVPTGMRSDQLVFVRDAEGLKSMTPAGAGSFGTDLIGQAGDRAKVWYGHALRTPPDGTNPGYQLGDDDAGLDSVGSNFIFARQALLFDPYSATTTDPLSTAAAGYTYADQGYATSTVTGSGYSEATDRTFHGITDVTIQDYGPAATAGTLLYQLSDAATAANHTTNYLATSYRVNANRLRVNPAPDADATNYESWAIAQSHPIMAQGCSEIIIDFAADLNGDGQIDTDFGGQGAVNAPIWWYDGLTQPNLTDGIAGGTTGWTNQASIPQPWFDNSADKKIFIFRVDDDEPYDTTAGGTQAHSYWPYLIRIRYRLHDTRGRLTSNYAPALNDGVDNDGDGDTDEFEEDKISGRWFERIIKVNRP